MFCEFEKFAFFSRPTPSNVYQPQPEAQNAPQMGIDSLIGNQMVTGMAMQYGQDFMGRGQEEIKKNLDKYVSIGQLKYYFAVDTSYVAKKLGKNSQDHSHSTQLRPARDCVEPLWTILNFRACCVRVKTIWLAQRRQENPCRATS